MTFDSPYLLFTLLLTIPWFFVRKYYFNKIAVPFSPLQFNVKKSILNPFQIILFTEILILSTSILLFSGPHFIKEIEIAEEKGIDILFLLDISGSMQAEDILPNRLSYMKKLTLEMIKKNESDRIGVLVFAQDIFTQTHLTSDRKILEELVGSISYESIDHSESGGSALGDAILAGVDMLLKGRDGLKRNQVLILITDGENTHGVDPTIAAKYIQMNAIKFYSIGIGSEQSVPVYVKGKPFIGGDGKILHTTLDLENLRKIAESGGGVFLHASNNEDLKLIFNEMYMLEKSLLEKKIKMIREPALIFLPFLLLLFFLFWLIFQYIYMVPMR